jgi:hypothetical protein
MPASNAVHEKGMWIFEARLSFGDYWSQYGKCTAPVLPEQSRPHR